MVMSTPRFARPSTAGEPASAARALAVVLIPALAALTVLIVAHAVAQPLGSSDGTADAVPAAAPDLVVLEIYPDDFNPVSPPFSWFPLPVQVLVHNQGPGPADSTVTDVDLDASPWISIPTPAISPGDTATVTYWVTPYPSMGTHSVKAQADAAGEVAETDETNNSYNDVMTILAVDLAVTEISPDTVHLTTGSHAPLDITVTNLGSLASPPTETWFWLGNDPPSVIPTPAIGPGESLVLSHEVGFYTWGEAEVGACADASYTDVVEEWNESNNCLTQSVAVFAYNLVVEDISPRTLILGQSSVLTATITNTGWPATPFTQTSFYADGSPLCPLVSTNQVPGPFGSVYVQCDVGSLTPGPHMVGVCADARTPEDAQEFDETDNCLTVDVTVLAANVVVDRILPVVGQAGAPITVTAYVKNIGTHLAGNSRSRIEADEITKCLVVTDPIPPGGEVAVSCDVGSFGGKEVVIRATADATGMVEEGDESDNQLEQAIGLAPATPIIVKADGTGDHPTIQAAIDASTDGDVILLADGFFVGPGNFDLDFGGRAITVRSQSGNPVACGLDLGGTAADPKRGFIFQSGETGTSILAGIMIFEGYEAQGGGILCDGSSPRISNVMFLNCEASNDGGGLACINGSSPTVRLCEYYWCAAVDDGGAAFAGGGSSATFDECHFEDNSAGDRGGACDFTMNWFGFVDDCTFEDNSAVNGGALCFVYSYGPVTDCVFRENGGTYGGAIQCYGNAQCTIERCTFYLNHGGYGNSLYCRNNSSPTVNESILAFGTPAEAVARYATDCNPTLTCTDVYGHAGGDWVDAIVGQDGSNGNLHVDPMFCDAAGGKLTLAGESPCAAGNNPPCGGMGALPVGCGFIYTVNPEGTGDFATIQGAIDSVQAGDVVELADGLYIGTGNRDVDFRGKGVTVRSRNGIPAACIVYCQGTGSNLHRGFSFVSGEDSTAVLEGLTIFDGWEIGGAGIHCVGSSPTLRNLRVRSCQADDDGGGILLEDHSSPLLDGCEIASNVAADDGGGLHGRNWSSPRISNCYFEGNVSGDRGGGAGFSVNCFPEVSDCVFEENTGVNGGGLTFVYSYGPVIRCLFNANTAVFGGGLYLYGNAQVPISSTTIAYNEAPSGGGGIYFRLNSSPSIENTIVAFSASGGAVGRHADDCNPTFACCDFYGNSGGDWVGFAAAQYGISGNWITDPMFCSAEDGEFVLHAASDCLPGANSCGVLVGAFGEGCTTVGVEEEPIAPAPRPLRVQPNPFRVSTTIFFELPEDGLVAIDVFDLSGRRVACPAGEEWRPAGTYSVTWNGRDLSGRRVASGVYFCCLRTSRGLETARLLVLR